MGSELNENKDQSELKIQRAIILVVAILLLMILAISSVLISREFEDDNDITQIYGIWDEQNVPGYAQDSFVVREEGIYINERVVAVNYSFDGRFLIYQYDEKEYKYRVANDANTELKRVAPLHYESTFFLRGKHQDLKKEAAVE